MIVFENSELLPDAWRTEAGATESARVFNPGLVRDGESWIVAYRVVIGAEGRRRIALCRLDASLRVIAATQVAFSDRIRFADPDAIAPQAREWFADPRLYRFEGRLFVYWNSGWHEPQNHQFLQEVDPVSLQPVGTARELQLSAQRQKLEKNWMLFEHESELFAVYSVNPHRVMSVSLAGSGAIACQDIGSPMPNPAGHAQLHGGLRGGAPPQLKGNHFYSFCHSIHDADVGYRYVASVYRFAAKPPFAPTDMPARPLPIEVPTKYRRRLPKLNPAVGDVIYPGGAIHERGSWLLGFGIDDERCAIVRLPEAAVDATLGPVAPPA